ncbi:acetate--CoA ligase family protein [Rhodoplanes sp. Z2-YC6860]|uniref:acetate--CoA ligase family protein n=1 Tax=Rhodoplanes sp. Z2-YC6860 TaxID=674703 RepID=UPI00078B9FC9|nr:acetate--CoA ligase family protein [Rhodoplanes sp. Z2-YC6860]AMN40495.1 acyl-CoA synthetase [Rhodoplanes sp. Z2-YC6860]
MADPELSKLLRPRSVAVVGASAREGSTGLRLLRHLRMGGFDGPVYPINPRYPEILGIPCYRTLSDVPGPIDAMFIALPADAVLPVLEEGGRLGVGAAVVNAAGFADAGQDGTAIQDEMVRVATQSSMALCGPNTNGVMSLLGNAYLCGFVPHEGAKRGGVAICTQSGSLANMLSRDIAGLGSAYVVSAGNEAILTTAEYLEAFVRDDQVKVILLTLEAVRRPAALAQAALAAAAKGKTVIALKVGRSERGRAAVQAHTGALAGEDALYDAYFRRLGIVRVGDLDEMVETAAMFVAQPRPPAHVGLVPMTFSGGHAAMLADLCEDLGLALAVLSEQTRTKLKAIFPSWWQPSNPIDAWGDGWDPLRFEQTLEIVAADPAASMIVMTIMPQPARRISSEVATILRRIAERSGCRCALISDSSGGPREPSVAEVLDGSGIAYLSGLRNGMTAIARWAKARPPEQAPKTPATLLEECRAFVAGCGGMNEPQRFAFMTSIGSPMLESEVVRTAADAARAAQLIGAPVVLKGCAPDVLHKSEHGLVAIGLADAAKVSAAFDELSAKLRRISRSPLAEIMLQPLAKTGIELIVGVRNHPGFGSLLVVGLGGTFVELLKESSERLGPVDQTTARAMLDETRAGRVLRGFRGQGPYDIDAAAAAIAAVSHFGAATIGSVAALEINPMIVHKAGEGVSGVDLVIELQPRAV